MNSLVWLAGRLRFASNWAHCKRAQCCSTISRLLIGFKHFFRNTLATAQTQAHVWRARRLRFARYETRLVVPPDFFLSHRPGVHTTRSPAHRLGISEKRRIAPLKERRPVTRFRWLWLSHKSVRFCSGRPSAVPTGRRPHTNSYANHRHPSLKRYFSI